MKDSDLICQDWVLYGKEYSPVVSKDSYTGQEFSDIKEEQGSIRVFGSKKQLEDLEDNYEIDEIYDYKIEKADSYWYKILGDEAKDYNTKVSIKLKKYRELYKINNREALIIKMK